MSKINDLTTITHIEDKILGVGAYEDRFNFKALAHDSETLSCNLDHYVLINKGRDNEERIDFGKSFRAIDYAEAYIEQSGVPKYTLLTFDLIDSTPGITSGYVKLNVSMGYGTKSHIDTLSFEFNSIEQRAFFIDKLNKAHKAHLNNDDAFHYSLVMSIFENVKKAFSEEPISELENL